MPDPDSKDQTQKLAINVVVALFILVGHYKLSNTESKAHCYTQRFFFVEYSPSLTFLYKTLYPLLVALGQETVFCTVWACWEMFSKSYWIINCRKQHLSIKQRSLVPPSLLVLWIFANTVATSILNKRIHRFKSGPCGLVVRWSSNYVQHTYTLGSEVRTLTISPVSVDFTKYMCISAKPTRLADKQTNSEVQTWTRRPVWPRSSNYVQARCSSNPW